MKRIGQIEYVDRNGSSALIEREQRAPNPLAVSVLLADDTPNGTLIELLVYNNGSYELTETVVGGQERRKTMYVNEERALRAAAE